MSIRSLHRSTRRQLVTTSGAALVAMASSSLAATPGTLAQTPGATPRLRVAVSTPLLANIVHNIAGDHADVFSIMPSDADPHTWEATPQDIIRVTESDTFISIGAHLEPFVEAGGWRRAVKDNRIPVLTVADHVGLIVVDKVIDHGDHVHDLREGDPHIWLDPIKVVEAIPTIQAHLSTLDPASADEYAAAALAYATSLTSLHDELSHDFAAIPAERRMLIVFHDAFTYFAARYDFQVAGIVLKHPEAGDVSAQEIVNIQETIEETGVKVIFAEPQFNTDVLTIFIDEQDVTVGELLTDSFADRVSTYVELMRFNRDSLCAHLIPMPGV